MMATKKSKLKSGLQRMRLYEWKMRDFLHLQNIKEAKVECYNV